MAQFKTLVLPFTSDIPKSSSSPPQFARSAHHIASGTNASRGRRPRRRARSGRCREGRGRREGRGQVVPALDRPGNGGRQQVVTVGGWARSFNQNPIPIGSMYGIYGDIYHQYTPNVSIYTIHGSYGIYMLTKMGS